MEQTFNLCKQTKVSCRAKWEKYLRAVEADLNSSMTFDVRSITLEITPLGFAHVNASHTRKDVIGGDAKDQEHCAMNNGHEVLIILVVLISIIVLGLIVI